MFIVFRICIHKLHATSFTLESSTCNGYTCSKDNEELVEIWCFKRCKTRKKMA